MPDTDLARHSNVTSVEQFIQRVLATREKNDWEYSPCIISRVAQDQAIIEVQGNSGTETYTALRRPSSRDIQSELVANPDFPRLESIFRHLVYARSHSTWGAEQPAPAEGPAESFDKHDSPDWTSNELARAILETDEQRDWARLRDVILAAEQAGFTPEQNRQLAPRLLELAIKYRDSTDPQDRAIVWSAIRTGASMLHPGDVHRLRPLLEPGHAIETTGVAVKMLGRVFEAQPPSVVDQYPDLASEVGQIAHSLLNRYAIASSQSAALAQLAIYAMAAMACTETLRLAAMVRDIGHRWFVRQTARELRQLLEYWNSSPTPVANAPREILEQSIRVIALT